MKNYFFTSLRLFVTLTLLLIGAKGAVAQTPTFITDLTKLSDDKLYMINVPRKNFVLANTEISATDFQLRATGKYKLDGTDTNIDSREMFTLLKSPTKSGVYYLVSIYNNKLYFAPTGTGTTDAYDLQMLDSPQGGFRFEANTTGNHKETHPWLLKTDREGGHTTINIHEVNEGNNWMRPRVTINSGGYVDEGNEFRIMEAGTVSAADKAAAFEKIYAFENFTPSAAIENGCFYTIAGGIDKDYKYLSAHLSKAGTNGEVTTPGFVVRKQESDDLLSRLWRFETSGEGNKIISANFNRGISGTPQDASKKEGLSWRQAMRTPLSLRSIPRDFRDIFALLAARMAN